MPYLVAGPKPASQPFLSLNPQLCESAVKHFRSDTKRDAVLKPVSFHDCRILGGRAAGVGEVKKHVGIYGGRNAFRLVVACGGMQTRIIMVVVEPPVVQHRTIARRPSLEFRTVKLNDRHVSVML